MIYIVRTQKIGRYPDADVYSIPCGFPLFHAAACGQSCNWSFTTAVSIPYQCMSNVEQPACFLARAVRCSCSALITPCDWRSLQSCRCHWHHFRAVAPVQTPTKILSLRLDEAQWASSNRSFMWLCCIADCADIVTWVQLRGGEGCGLPGSGGCGHWQPPHLPALHSQADPKPGGYCQPVMLLSLAFTHSIGHRADGTYTLSVQHIKW